MKHRPGLLTCVSGLSLIGALPAAAQDWVGWRGPEQNGLTREPAAVTSWSLDGDNLVWKNSIGGRTTPLIMGGRMFVIGPVGEGSNVQEAITCLDAATGKTVWSVVTDIFLTDMAENRVGWTALAGDRETGNVYAHTTSGEFLCICREGKVIWRHSLLEEYSRVSGYGGRLHTPVVDEDRVIVSFLNVGWGAQSRPTHRYLACDKRTGAVVWWSEPGGRPEDTTYSCPVVAVINGRRMLIAPNADGAVYGLLARTGEKVWWFGLSKRGLNVSPVVDGNLVYATHSEENLTSTDMGSVVCIDGSKTGDLTETGKVWRRDGLDVGYASLALRPTPDGSRLYAVDNSANLYCLDARTGETHWTYSLGRVGKGSPVVTADGVIYVGEQNGTFHILRDAGARCAPLCAHTFEGPNHAIDEIFGSPAVAGGRVYFMTRYGMYCLGDRRATPPVAAVPPLPPERKLTDPTPRYVTLFPADVALRPGEKVTFAVRAFSEDRLPLSETVAVDKWSAAGLAGSIDDGTYEAPATAGFGAGTVEAKVGALTAAARVRIVPPIPHREDFDGIPPDTVPSGWVGITGKTKVTQRDGQKVFMKTADKGRPSPAWRARGFTGLPTDTGYTVQADLLGTPIKRGRVWPDMGLINCRYEFLILGATKDLELSRWRDEPVHAVRKRMPFDVKAETWYTLKFRVDFKDGRATLRGKVWPRGEPEPPAWTIECTDERPTGCGSPGFDLYSNIATDKSDGAPVYMDNYQVTRND